MQRTENNQNDLEKKMKLEDSYLLFENLVKDTAIQCGTTEKN
jgi:hypothetical protein